MQNLFSLGKQGVKDVVDVDSIHPTRKKKAPVWRRSAEGSLVAGKVYMPSFLLPKEASALDSNGVDGEREGFSTISTFHSLRQKWGENEEVIGLD